MKAQLEKTFLLENRSVLTRHFTVPYFTAPFHFHPEYELTYILRGCGKRFVGTNIAPFEPGDLVLLGSQLAHCWQSDERHHQSGAAESEAIVVHLSVDFMEIILPQLPECASVNTLLTQSAHGIQFEQSEALVPLLRQLVNQGGLQQIGTLLTLLEALVYHPTTHLLVNEVSPLAVKQKAGERMQRVIEFTLTNFQRPIGLQEVSDQAHLSITSFCRYFRQYASKTYLEYLTEIRVTHACKLLGEPTPSIPEVGLLSGFPQVSTFHHVFKRRTGLSPLTYRQLVREGLPIPLDLPPCFPGFE